MDFSCSQQTGVDRLHRPNTVVTLGFRTLRLANFNYRLSIAELVKNINKGQSTKVLNDTDPWTLLFKGLQHQRYI